MAHGKIYLTHPVTQETKIVPVGYSWTTLFWGFFPALFRLDWLNLAIIGGVLTVTSFMGIGFIPLIIFSFIYNDKMCLKNHLTDGWLINRYMGDKTLREVGESVGFNLDNFKYAKRENKSLVG